MRRISTLPAFCSIGLLAFACAALAPPKADAKDKRAQQARASQVDDGSSIVQIAAVLASKEPGPPDPRLAPLKDVLAPLPFKSYSLLSAHACTVGKGEECAMRFLSKGYLQVTTIENADKHLKLRLLLNHNNKPALNADLKLNRNSGILVRTKRTSVGTVLIHVQAQTGAQETLIDRPIQ